MNDKIRGSFREDFVKKMSEEMYEYAVGIIPLFISFAAYKEFGLMNFKGGHLATHDEVKQLQQELLDKLLKD